MKAQSSANVSVKLNLPDPEKTLITPEDPGHMPRCWHSQGYIHVLGDATAVGGGAGGVTEMLPSTPIGVGWPSRQSSCRLCVKISLRCILSHRDVFYPKCFTLQHFNVGCHGIYYLDICSSRLMRQGQDSLLL